jgi:hypothetical protein
MNVTIYECIYNNTKYTIRNAIITSINTQVIDIVDSEFVQYFVSERLHKITLSVSSTKHIDKYNIIIDKFISKTLECRKVNMFSTPFIYFQTPNAIFHVDIRNEPYHYSIKVGSNHFKECVDVMVYKPVDYKTPHKLAQIYSEPECWNDLVKGNTIDMIKGSLQFIETVFDVHSFVFDDNSNIECGITNMSQKPPRKLTIPFSLGHLFLATKCKTWYEYNFGAVIHDSEIYADYKARVSIFDTPKILSADDFFQIACMTSEQQLYLQPYYEKTNTWLEFFTSIPKHKQCFAFYNWLPFFIDGYLLNTNKKGKFELRKHEWRIDMYNESFIRTLCIINLDHTVYVSNSKNSNTINHSRCKTNKNKNKKNQTLKNKVNILSLSNEMIGQTI